MNYTRLLPGFKLEFTDTNARHRAFFAQLLFDLPGETLSPAAVIHIHFKKTDLSRAKAQVEEDTLSDGNHFYILDTKKRAVEVNFAELTPQGISMNVDPDFDLYYLFTFILEPLMIVLGAHLDLMFLHSSGVISPEGNAVVFPAWRHTGKTHTILNLTQRGWLFGGDDYCVLHKEMCYVYPKKINIFSYNFQHLPALWQHLPIGQRVRLQCTMRLKQGIGLLARLTHGALGKILFRLAQLAEVTTNIQLTPAQLGIPVAVSGKVKKIGVLQSSSQSHTEEESLSLTDFAAKVTSVIEYELSDFFRLINKFHFLFPQADMSLYTTFLATYEQNVKKIHLPTALITLGAKKELDLPL